MDFSSLLPDIKPWVQSLAQVWPAPIIKASSWMFPIIQTFHLLALVTLGGAVLLPSLRLMGAGMTSVSPASIEKTVRPWMWAALIVLVLTGLLMGLVNPMRLYTRPGFLIKMIALAAALIFSFGVVGPLSRCHGAASGATRIWAIAGLIVWIAAILVFASSFGAAPGSFHVICVGWLVVMGLGSRTTRIVLGAITALIAIGVGIVTYGVFTPLEDYDIVMEINRWTLRCSALLVAGFALWEFVRPRPNAPTGNAMANPTLARLAGLGAILAWFTVAAAGRWIGLGGGAG